MRPNSDPQNTPNKRRDLDKTNRLSKTHFFLTPCRMSLACRTRFALIWRALGTLTRTHISKLTAKKATMLALRANLARSLMSATVGAEDVARNPSDYYSALALITLSALVACRFRLRPTIFWTKSHILFVRFCSIKRDALTPCTLRSLWQYHFN